MLKLLISLALALFASTSQAACSPASPSDVRVGYESTPISGFWAYWYCVDSVGVVTVELRAIPSAAMTSTLASSIAGYAKGTNPTFAATAPTLPMTDPSVAPLIASAASAASADAAKPEVWKSVLPGTLYSRNTYYVITGVISGSSVPAGTLLNCKSKTTLNSNVYCPISGGVSTQVTLAKKVSP